MSLNHYLDKEQKLNGVVVATWNANSVLPWQVSSCLKKKKKQIIILTNKIETYNVMSFNRFVVLWANRLNFMGVAAAGKEPEPCLVGVNGTYLLVSSL